MLTEEIQLQRKHFLVALESQPEAEVRTRGVLAYNGQYCAVGLAATLADIPVDIGMADCWPTYYAVMETYMMDDNIRDSVIKMNDMVDYEETKDGEVVNVTYVNTWNDIAAMLRKEWKMDG